MATQAEIAFPPRRPERRIVRCDRGRTVRFEERVRWPGNVPEDQGRRLLEGTPTMVGPKGQKFEALLFRLHHREGMEGSEASPADFGAFFGVPCGLSELPTVARESLERWIAGGDEAHFGRRPAPSVCAA